MTQIRRVDAFIEGISLVRDLVIASSFYNSSGDSVSFCLSSEPSAETMARLAELGWEYGGKEISFRQWGRDE